MDRPKKFILERLNTLVQQAESLLKNLIHPTEAFFGSYADTTLSIKWRTSSLEFLRLTFGENGTHYSEFSARSKTNGESDIKMGLGILLSAKDDIESGYLDKVESLISADIFADFLSMAEHLQTEGYFHPAASLAGAVLEDAMKKICQNNNVDFKTHDGLHTLNEKLAKQQVYNQIQFKNIDSWRSIRNAADHGQFNEFTNDQVKNMIDGIQLFIGKYQT